MTRPATESPLRAAASAAAVVLSISLLAGCAADPRTSASSRAPDAGSGLRADPTSSAEPAKLLYEADWARGAGDWPATGESWKAAGGMLVNDGTANGAEMSIQAPVDLSGTADYVVDADIQLVAYSNNVYASFGIVVRAPEEGGGYGAGHCAAAGLFTCDGASEHTAVIWTAEAQPSLIKARYFRPGESWHHYRVAVKGNELTLTIDGGLVLKASDNRFVSSGRVGLWSNAAQVSVRTFTVHAL